MNAEERLEKVIAKIELAKEKHGNKLPELDNLEFIVELLSIANQRFKELGEKA